MRQLSLVVLLGACVVGDVEDEEVGEVVDGGPEGFETFATCAAYGPTGTAAPVRCFSKKAKHNDQCVRAKQQFVPLRFPNGKPTGYVLDTFAIAYTENLEKRTLDEDDQHTCWSALESKFLGGPQQGEIQLDEHEIVVGDNGEWLAFHRGGYPYAPSKDFKYGHVAVADLTGVGAPVKYADAPECEASQVSPTNGVYAIKPTSMAGLFFRTIDWGKCIEGKTLAQLKDCTMGFSSFGNPGVEAGGYAPFGHHDYAPLTWNFVNVRGGGVERALLPPGQPFYRCNVAPMDVTAYTEDGFTELGRVRAIYGKTRIGKQWLYGWVVHSHCTGANCSNVVPHLTRL